MGDNMKPRIGRVVAVVLSFTALAFAFQNCSQPLGRPANTSSAGSQGGGPGGSNSFFKTGLKDSLLFSREGGVPVAIELKNDSGATIKWTVNGAEKTNTSKVFTIHVPMTADISVEVCYGAGNCQTSTGKYRVSRFAVIAGKLKYWNTATAEFDEVAGADAASAVLLDSETVQDKDNVHFNGTVRVARLPAGANYTLLSGGYATMGGALYYRETLMNGVSPAAFTRIGRFNLGKTATAVYCGANVIAGADPATFTTVYTDYANLQIDANTVYTGCAPSTVFQRSGFKAFPNAVGLRPNHGLFQAGGKVYYLISLQSADRAAGSAITTNYYEVPITARSAANMTIRYFTDTPFEPIISDGTEAAYGVVGNGGLRAITGGIDINTATTLRKEALLKDSQRLFALNSTVTPLVYQPVAGISGATLKEVSVDTVLSLYKDANTVFTVFYDGTRSILANAHAPTFEKVGRLYRDQNGLYTVSPMSGSSSQYEIKPFTTVSFDRATLKYLGGDSQGYFADKSLVVHYGSGNYTAVDAADPATLALVGSSPYVLMDKNAIYVGPARFAQGDALTAKPVTQHYFQTQARLYFTPDAGFSGQRTDLGVLDGPAKSVVGQYIVAGGTKLYANGVLVPNIAAEKLVQFPQTNYFSDGANVVWLNFQTARRVTDAASFRFLAPDLSLQYATDGSAILCDGQPLTRDAGATPADPATFRVTGSVSARDKNGAYSRCTATTP